MDVHGKGGSASTYSTKINMYGHDGLMGSNGPIGVGACFATGKPTIILGDAKRRGLCIRCYGMGL